MGDVINWKRGYDLTEKDRKHGPFPVVSSSGVSGCHNEYKVIAPGVVTGRTGSLGTAYFIKENFWPHNTSLYITDFKGNDPKYIYYLMNCLGRIKTSDKSTVPGVNRNELHSMVIPVVEDVLEQKKIANVLSALDDKIELNNRINAELEAMAKTLYDYWFVQFDFLDANGKPYKTSGGKMTYNSTLKRKIPEGWEVGSLVDIATFTNGIACQKYFPQANEKGVYKVIKIREFSSGLDESSDVVTANVPSDLIIHDADVLFSWSATLDVKLWTGGTGVLNQHIYKVTSESYPKSFFYFVLLGYLDYFKMVAELRKTTMGHITKDHLEMSRLPLPPQSLINQLDTILNPILHKIVKNRQESTKLEQLRDWLLPMLMNGQVNVTTD